MEILITFLPLLIGLVFPAGVLICVWLIMKKSSGNKDLLIQQLMEKNAKLEAKVELLLEEVKASRDNG
jgi:hypothetical protein